METNNSCKRCNKFLDNICQIKCQKRMCSGFIPLDIYSFKDNGYTEVYRTIDSNKIHLINGYLVEEDLKPIRDSVYLNPLNPKEVLVVIKEENTTQKDFIITKDKYPSSIERNKLYYSPIEMRNNDLSIN